MDGTAQGESAMRTVAEIKQDVLALPEADYAELMVWLDEMCERKWNEWDRQIEADAKAGRLDFFEAEALEAKRKGELQDL